jgi:hypothetical protein
MVYKMDKGFLFRSGHAIPSCFIDYILLFNRVSSANTYGSRHAILRYLLYTGKIVGVYYFGHYYFLHISLVDLVFGKGDELIKRWYSIPETSSLSSTPLSSSTESKSSKHYKNNNIDASGIHIGNSENARPNKHAYDLSGGFYDISGYYDISGFYYDLSGGYYDKEGRYFDASGGYYDTNGDYYELISESFISSLKEAFTSSEGDKPTKKKYRRHPKSQLDEANSKNTQPMEEVFNISNNLYTYDDAKDICKAFDARLATYDEIEDSYNNAGEWCNYGWSEGQMALFPTQKTTWLEMQKDEKRKNDCGRPGVNGGFMENPYLKFGVNCFGMKPKAKDADIDNMNANKLKIVPKTEKDVELDKRVEFWKQNADKMLVLNSFNKDKWTEY